MNKKYNELLYIIVLTLTLIALIFGILYEYKKTEKERPEIGVVETPAPVVTPYTPIKTPIPYETTIPPTPTPVPKKTMHPIDAQISKLSQRDRIAQQIVTYLPAKASTVSKFLSKNQTGGLLINKKEGFTLSELAAFSYSLRQHTKKHGLIMPLLMIDQEGGKVSRIKDLNSLRLTNAKLAKKRNNKEIIAMQGELFGISLHNAGIDINLAPVVDVVTNKKNTIIGRYGRSYSSDTDLVSRLALIFSKSLQKKNVIPTLKHFPGHGMVTSDSHKTLPHTNITYKNLQEKHIKPYIEILEALDNNRIMVMTAHVLYKNLDSTLPASLSSKITTELLRNKLGYKGVVITDALGMKALKKYSIKERVFLALNAGADFALIDDLTGNNKIVPGIIDYIYDRYQKNPSLWSNNAKSLKRIFTLRSAINKNVPETYLAPKGDIPDEDSKDIVQQSTPKHIETPQPPTDLSVDINQEPLDIKPESSNSFKSHIILTQGNKSINRKNIKDDNFLLANDFNITILISDIKKSNHPMTLCMLYEHNADIIINLELKRSDLYKSDVFLEFANPNNQLKRFLVAKITFSKRLIDKKNFLRVSSNVIVGGPGDTVLYLCQTDNNSIGCNPRLINNTTSNCKSINIELVNR